VHPVHLGFWRLHAVPEAPRHQSWQVCAKKSIACWEGCLACPVPVNSHLIMSFVYTCAEGAGGHADGRCGVGGGPIALA